MARLYEEDAVKLKLDVMDRMLKGARTAERTVPVLKQAVELMEEAIDEDKVEVGRKLYQQVLLEARRVHDMPGTGRSPTSTSGARTG